MKIQPINNNTYNTSFNGIKLSTDNVNEIWNIITALKFNGLHCIGKKSFNIEDSLREKAYLAHYMRTNHQFPENFYGVLFFPFSHEAYIIADRLLEQQMLKNVCKLDKEAKINLWI